MSPSQQSGENNFIDRNKFKELIQKHLVPLFSGAKLKDGFKKSISNQKTVAFNSPCELRVKPSEYANYCLVIERSQPFAKASSDFITEYKVAKAFISVLADIKDAIGTAFEQDLLSTIKRRIVARALCDDPKLEFTLLSSIDQLDLWSTRLYEGQPISVSMGFEPSCRPRDTISLDDLWYNDFGSVITNGFDTLLVSSYSGKLKAYESLPKASTIPSYAPHRLAPIAFWTTLIDDRIAIVLNRTSEILIFRDGQLIFSRRGGIWHFLAYEPVITQMKCPQNANVRKAVLESCLDASFARTGACVGILRSRHEQMLKKVAPEERDHTELKTSAKSILISKIIAGQKFQSIDRRLRQELMAIDGATILGHDGKVLAVGAILNIAGGSTGGGRTAAAKELSKYGTGIKVSEDGYIEAYYRRDPKEKLILAFSMMKSG